MRITFLFKAVAVLLLFISFDCQKCFPSDSGKERIIDSLKNVISNSQHDTITVDAYLQWGELIYMQNPDSAIKKFTAALSVCDKAVKSSENDDLINAFMNYQVILINNLGTMYYLTGEVETSLRFYTNGLEISKKIGDKSGIAASLNNLGQIEESTGSMEKAIDYYTESLKLREEIGSQLEVAESFNNIGTAYYYMGNIVLALDYYQKSLKIKEEVGDKMNIALSLNNIGYIYDKQGDIESALEFYHRSLEIREEIDDKKGIAESFNNIGIVHDLQGDKKRALQYYHKSLSIYKEINHQKDIARSYNNIAAVYHDISKLSDNDAEKKSSIDSALAYYNSCLIVYYEVDHKEGIARGLNNIATVYRTIGENKKALEKLEESLKMYEQLQNKEGIALALNNLSAVYYSESEYEKAERCAERSLSIGRQLGFPDKIDTPASWLKKIFKRKGNFEKAYEYFELEILMRDSIISESNRKKALEQEARYKYEKQHFADSVEHSNALQIKDLEISRQEEVTKRQTTIIYSFVIGFLMIAVFSVIILRLFVQKKKANILLALRNDEILQKNEEITAHRDEIEAQRDEIVKHRDIILNQKEEIEDSIHYAKRIQTAALPSPKYAKAILGDHFIIFKPKDVVSGDFFWAAKTDEWTVVTAADCTGHGVPGAFMSMLGVSFLNEIVRKKDVTSSADILNHLRSSVIDALNQSTYEKVSDESISGLKDGLDMSILAIHKNRNQALWAGANNPLWIIRKENINKELEDSADAIEFIKGDSMPVAIYIKMDKFTNHEIQLNSDDRLFLFSDGFPDQFGGPRGKKYKYKPFKRLIASTSTLPIKEQGEKMEEAFNAWVDYEGKHYDQIDDITIIGLKI